MRKIEIERLTERIVDKIDSINDYDRWMIPGAIICLAYFAGITIYSLL